MKHLIAILSLACALAVAETYEIGNRSDLNRVDVMTNGRMSIMPESIFTDCVLWQAFSYSDNSAADFYDLSTSGNDGAQGASASRPTWSSADGGTYDFDGINDSIPIADAASLSVSGGATFTAWVNMDDATAFRIIGKWGSTALLREYNFSTTGSDLMSVGIYDAEGDRIGRTTAAVTSLEGSWHFFAATWDGGTASSGISIYTDGAATDNADFNSGTWGAYSDTASVVEIGSLADASSYADGKIDDARIYAAALTAAQIGSIYTNTAPTYGISP